MKQRRWNYAYEGINIEKHVVKHTEGGEKEIKYDGCQVCDEPYEDSPRWEEQIYYGTCEKWVQQRCGRYHNRESFMYTLCMIYTL